MNNYPKITEYLNKCVKNDAVSHAYVFYGPDETAKKNTALKFARELLNSDIKFHPDLMLISSGDDEKRSINMIRQLIKFLTLSSYSGKYKIAIIESAEKLNYYAQNALLKTFEEAPDKSVIILLARTIDSIAETIVSRSVKLPFWRPTDLKSPIDEKTEKIFEEILNGDFKNGHRGVEKLSNLKAVEAFKMWLEFLRTEFLKGQSEKLAGILKTSQNIYFKLNETNINPKFAYDELLLSLLNMNRCEHTNS